MDLRIVHTTTYAYQGSVDLAQHMVHLTPVDTPTQRVRAHTLRIDPEPATRNDVRDAFGNVGSFFSLQAPHDTLTVEADSLVQTRVPRPLPCGDTAPAWQALGWEAVREQFRYRAHAPYNAASEFLYASPHVPRDDRFAAFARPAFLPGRSMLEATSALMERIHTGLTYETASTGVNTPALSALAQGKGVCQDFAHIMIGCLRSLGLPAHYVSGYLLTQPPPGQPRLIGADASHAWVAVYVPEPAPSIPGQGAWFHFDPTNNRVGESSPGEDYVQLARGRDFSDVSPMRGVIQGGAQHTLTVAVTVAPAEELEVLQTVR
jgi:transglutaminase-like putative cysteine protease